MKHGIPSGSNDNLNMVTKHQDKCFTGSSSIGEPCILNTDCKDNMYCPTGTCQCIPPFVATSETSSCLPIINPGQVGCFDNIQCSGAWPGATCVAGVCVCDASQYIGSVETQDGTVCLTANKCPLPSGSSFTGTTSIDNLNDADNPDCVFGSTDYTNPIKYCNGETLGGSPDIYDCIPNSLPAIPEHTPGRCCPSRALACIQPKLVAPTTAKATETRYWYNSITGGCEMFIFDKSGTNTTNSNAFLTTEHCLSYCGSTCKHGPPRLNSAIQTSFTGIERTTHCMTNSDCGTDSTQTYTCTRTGQTNICCPTAAFICGISGGRQVTSINTPNIISVTPDSGIAPSGGTAPSSTRWFYSQAAGTCSPFTYFGTNGNFNNFLTETDCLSFCALTVCEQGQPLKTDTGSTQVCTAGRGCPTSYECKSNVCCPRKQTVCIQSKMKGICSSSITSFWYNAGTGDCEPFQYTGCRGNDNNFASYATCIAYCREVNAEPRCIQGEADKDFSGRYVTCSSSSNCRTNYECYFDGTNFGCCPLQSYTCSLELDTGTACLTSTFRWFYNSIAKACQVFMFGGCDGNSNNFINKEDCELYCGNKELFQNFNACGALIPVIDPATHIARGCSFTNACPSGTCTLNVQNGVSYCCISTAGTDPDGCGAGLIAYREPSTMVFRTCTVGPSSNCPNGFNCQSTTPGHSRCCGVSSGCPFNSAAFIDPTTRGVTTCSSSSTCQSGFSCLNTTTSGFVCCSTGQALTFSQINNNMATITTVRCPLTTQTPYVPVGGTNPQRCNPGPCPANYQCVNSGNGFICCSIQLKMCPNDTLLATDATTGVALSCMTQACPPNYRCTYSTSYHFYYCCSQPSASRQQFRGKQ